MKAKLAAAWAWIREHWIAIAVTTLAVVGALIGWQLLRRPLAGSFKGQVEVERKRREIERLRGERDRLVAEANEAEPRIEQIDAALAKNKREIVAAHQSVEGMTATDVAAAFDDLGY